MIDDYGKILISDAKDIRGLEDVSMFPLATGWWIIIGLMGLAVLFGYFKKFQNYRYQKTWKFKVIKRLDAISENLNEENKKDSIAEITDILKRISIHIYGRNEVASLNGKDWLRWLEIRDPGNFNWKKNGELLINYPYMQGYKIPVKDKEVKDLIKAIKNWL